MVAAACTWGEGGQKAGAVAAALDKLFATRTDSPDYVMIIHKESHFGYEAEKWDAAKVRDGYMANDGAPLVARYFVTMMDTDGLTVHVAYDKAGTTCADGCVICSPDEGTKAESEAEKALVAKVEADTSAEANSATTPGSDN